MASNGARRTDGSLGGHRGGMTGQGDHRAGAASDGAARRDVHHNRHLAGADLLDHGVHQAELTARCVELQYDQFCRVALGDLNAALEVFQHRTVQRALQIHDVDPRGVLLGAYLGQRREQEQGGHNQKHHAQ